MPVYITPDEAKAMIARLHPDHLEIPRNYNFDKITNHLEAVAVFTALGDVAINLAQCYSAFVIRCPNRTSSQYRTVSDRKRWARDYINKVLRYASGDEHWQNERFLESVQRQTANEWQLDKDPLVVYQVDSSGEISKVEDQILQPIT